MAIEEGMEKGRKEGIADGMEKGIAKGMETVALRMLKDGFELPMISKITGLSEADIEGTEVGIVLAFNRG